MDREQGGDAPILVPVDFSENSAAALLWAAEAAGCFDAPLIVLHVVHDPAEAPGYYAASQGEGHREALEQAAARMLDEFVKREKDAHPQIAGVNRLSTALVVGLPETRILEMAEKTKARLIVMGSQGRTGLAHLMLGSKAQRVVQLSPIPVTIVKIPAAGADERDPGMRA